MQEYFQQKNNNITRGSHYFKLLVHTLHEYPGLKIPQDPGLLYDKVVTETIPISVIPVIRTTLN